MCSNLQTESQTTSNITCKLCSHGGVLGRGVHPAFLSAAVRISDGILRFASFPQGTGPILMSMQILCPCVLLRAQHSHPGVRCMSNAHQVVVSTEMPHRHRIYSRGLYQKAQEAAMQSLLMVNPC